MTIVSLSSSTTSFSVVGTSEGYEARKVEVVKTFISEGIVSGSDIGCTVFVFLLTSVCRFANPSH